MTVLPLFTMKVDKDEGASVSAAGATVGGVGGGAGGGEVHQQFHNRMVIDPGFSVEVIGHPQQQQQEQQQQQQQIHNQQSSWPPPPPYLRQYPSEYSQQHQQHQHEQSQFGNPTNQNNSDHIQSSSPAVYRTASESNIGLHQQQQQRQEQHQYQQQQRLHQQQQQQQQHHQEHQPISSTSSSSFSLPKALPIRHSRSSIGSEFAAAPIPTSTSLVIMGDHHHHQQQQQQQQQQQEKQQQHLGPAHASSTVSSSSSISARPLENGRTSFSSLQGNLPSQIHSQSQSQSQGSIYSTNPAQAQAQAQGQIGGRYDQHQHQHHQHEHEHQQQQQQHPFSAISSLSPPNIAEITHTPTYNQYYDTHPQLSAPSHRYTFDIGYEQQRQQRQNQMTEANGLPFVPRRNMSLPGPGPGPGSGSGSGLGPGLGLAHGAYSGRQGSSFSGSTTLTPIIIPSHTQTLMQTHSRTPSSSTPNYNEAFGHQQQQQQQQQQYQYQYQISQAQTQAQTQRVQLQDTAMPWSDSARRRSSVASVSVVSARSNTNINTNTHNNQNINGNISSDNAASTAQLSLFTPHIPGDPIMRSHHQQPQDTMMTYSAAVVPAYQPSPGVNDGADGPYSASSSHFGSTHLGTSPGLQSIDPPPAIRPPGAGQAMPAPFSESMMTIISLQDQHHQQTQQQHPPPQRQRQHHHPSLQPLSPRQLLPSPHHMPLDPSWSSAPLQHPFANQNYKAGGASIALEGRPNGQAGHQDNTDVSALGSASAPVSSSYEMTALPPPPSFRAQIHQQAPTLTPRFTAYAVGPDDMQEEADFASSHEQSRRNGLPLNSKKLEKSSQLKKRKASGPVESSNGLAKSILRNAEFRKKLTNACDELVLLAADYTSSSTTPSLPNSSSDPPPSIPTRIRERMTELSRQIVADLSAIAHASGHSSLAIPESVLKETESLDNPLRLRTHATSARNAYTTSKAKEKPPPSSIMNLQTPEEAARDMETIRVRRDMLIAKAAAAAAAGETGTPPLSEEYGGPRATSDAAATAQEGDRDGSGGGGETNGQSKPLKPKKISHSKKRIPPFTQQKTQTQTQTQTQARPKTVKCHSCGVTDANDGWEAGPDGPETLCARCGSHWSKQSKNGIHILGKSPPPPPPIGKNSEGTTERSHFHQKGWTTRTTVQG